MKRKEHVKNDHRMPLAVDVDGSLLRTDLLLECFFAALAHSFLATLAVLLRNLWNRPRLKAELARLAQLDLATLPVNQEVLAFCRAWDGPVVLASAADRQLVAGLAKIHGLGGQVLATEEGRNLKGPAKAAALAEAFGAGQFAYVGNARPDISVWKGAHRAIVVAPSAGLLGAVEAIGIPVTVIGQRGRAWDLVRGARVYQWVKNLLLFLPAIASHRAGIDVAGVLLTAFLAFSFAASAIYYANDLLDLEADRRHPVKRNRPLASGAVPILAAVAFATGLAISAALLAAWVGVGFLLTVAVYIAVSLAYSLKVKRKRWADLVFLALLYTLRVLAGGVALGLYTSGWLVSFAFALFFALGAVKRITELVRSADEGKLPGRNYSREDLGTLLRLAILAGSVAMAIYTAYTFSATARALYPHVWELRLAGLAVAAWIARMIWSGYRGKQDYDPILFAARDPVGLAMVIAGTGLLVHAAGAI